MRQIFILLLFYAVTASAQEVPSKMTVAGVRLTFTDRLQKELQKEVDALTISPKYFKIKVDRAKIYFPIIEQIFAEENVPDDIKYLVLQESALIPDAVSVSDAVGYWQFKDFTALEVGMRVDRQVDERMNIVSSSRGAARYLKKNYEYFNNWIFAVQAYQMGAGGALKVLDKDYFGATRLDLDHNTYWYVKKFLAHVIAFRDAVDGGGEIALNVYNEGSNKTLEELAKDMSVNYDQLLAYNVWLKKGKIPEDKIYPVLLPVKYNPATPIKVDIQKDEPAVIPPRVIIAEQSKFPVSGSKVPWFSKETIRTYNDIPGVMAEHDQTLIMLASAGDVSLSKFLKVNDVDVTHRVKPGQVYYFKRKKAKAGTYYHVVNHNETLWDISQRYGIRVSKLMFKNRLRSEEDIKPGLVLWLRHVRPADVPVEYKKIPSPEKELPASLPKEVVEKKPTAEPLMEVQEDSQPDTLQKLVTAVEDSAEMDAVKATHAEFSEEKITSAVSEEHDVMIAEEIPEQDSVESYFINHAILPKETLYSISKRYNVQVVDILEWNNLHISDKLSVGQELKILQEKPLIDEQEVVNLPDEQNVITHEVQPGETLYKLAVQYKVTVEDLMQWNNKSDYNLNPGEKLKVKKGK